MESRIMIMGSIGGAAVDSVAVLTGDGGESSELTLPAAKSGTLSTRTSDTAGTLTLGTGHGIQTGDTIDLYWDGGLRYGVTVGTVVGNSVPISGGQGDALPAQDTAVRAGIRVGVRMAFAGNDCAALGITATGRANAELREVGGSVVVRREVSSSAPWLWWPQLGSNPLADEDITEVWGSTGELEAKLLRAGFLFNSEIG